MGVTIDYKIPEWTAGYKAIVDPWEFVEQVLALNPPWIVVDTETHYNPLNTKAVIRFIQGQPNNEPFMFTFCIPGMGCFSLDHHLEALVELFRDYRGYVVNHNIKFDLHMMANIGLPLPKKIHDTMAMIQLLVPEHWCKTEPPRNPDRTPVLNSKGEPEKGKAKKSKALKNLAYHYLEAGGHFRSSVDPGFPQRKGTQWLEDAVDRLRAKLGRTTGRGKKAISYKDVYDADPELMRLYATVDVDLVAAMWEWFYNEIVRDEQLPAYEQDIAATIWLLNMERRGVRVDLLAMQRDELLLTGVIEDTETRLSRFGAFNINSGRDLVLAYATKFGIKWTWKTESGESDTTKARLEYVAENHPETAEFTELVLRYKLATHIRDTYIRGIYPLVQNGRIHADLLLAPMDDSTGATVTGRLSSRNPNMQNLPKHPVVIKLSDGGELVVRSREYYIPDEGCIFVRQDYSQQEYRMLGHYSQDEKFQQLIRDGLDVHTGCAAMILNIPYEEVTKPQRNNGKTINFALVYQLGNISFSKSLGHDVDEEKCKEATRFLYGVYPAYKLPPYSNEVSLEKALEHVVGSKPLLRDAITYFFTPEVGAAIKHALDVKAEYFAQFPAMKPFLDDVKRTAKTRGWIRNFYGRKYYFANPDRENYKAPNYLIQGGCSGICKERGVVVDNYLIQNRKSELTYTFLPIHDEFCFQFHEDDYDLILKTNEILSDLPFRVPITAGMDWGMNLHDKSDILGPEDIDKLPRA